VHGWKTEDSLSPNFLIDFQQRPFRNGAGDDRHVVEGLLGRRVPQAWPGPFFVDGFAIMLRAKPG